VPHSDFDWKFEIPTWEKTYERFKGGGKTVEEARETLVRYGLDAKLVERFLGEILEGQA